jgi:hypothetical protein
MFCIDNSMLLYIKKEKRCCISRDKLVENIYFSFEIVKLKKEPMENIRNQYAF